MITETSRRTAEAEVPVVKSQRLVSLDVFRGITIAGMILVNNPGNWSFVYPALGHAKWNGWTPTDLIFPFFIFIVGVAIAYAFAKRFEMGQSKGKIYLKIVRRTLVLFLLGLILNGFPGYDLSTIRITGVLQRIAVAYFFASVIFLNFKVKGQAVFLSGLLILYWLLMMLVPVPGYGAGVLTNTGNLSAYIDKVILSVHIWSGSKFWDPEGLLSTLPAIATALTGVLTGEFLKSRKSDYEKVSWMFVTGLAAMVAGTILDMWFPINKNLWSPSYVVFTSEMAVVFLAACYFLIDIKNFKKAGKPFVVFGMNALALFFLSGMVGRIIMLLRVGQGSGAVNLKTYIYQAAFASWAGDMNGSLFFAIAYIFFWFLILLWMYKRKIFVKI